MKKTFAKIAALAMAACLTLGLAACGGKEPPATGDDEWTMDRVYALAKEKGFEGTLDELIAQLKGKRARRTSRE